MEERMEKAILKGKANRAIGRDGVHIEMLQVTPQLSANLLSTWWAAVGRTGIFPADCEDGMWPMHTK